MRSGLVRKKELQFKRWRCQFPLNLLLTFILLTSFSIDVRSQHMHKIMKHMMKHMMDTGPKTHFLGIKGILVPIPIPMQMSLPTLKLPTIGFAKDDSGNKGDSGGGNGGNVKIKYVPYPVPAKGGGGKRWNGGWKSGGSDWNSGGGWASSNQAWSTPAKDEWKAESKRNYESREKMWKSDIEDWRKEEGYDWGGRVWRSYTDETDWDDDWR